MYRNFLAKIFNFQEVDMKKYFIFICFTMVSLLSGCAHQGNANRDNTPTLPSHMQNQQNQGHSPSETAAKMISPVTF